MAYEEFSTPKDLGTGLQDTVDWIDAASIAWLTHNANATGYVVDGFDFTVDWNNDILNIDSGVAEAQFDAATTNDHTAEGGPPEVNLQNVTFRLQRGPSGDINLGNGVNHVWVATSIVDNNDVSFYSSTDENEAPDDPHVKLGEVDTDEQTIRQRPHPDVSANRLLISPGEYDG